MIKETLVSYYKDMYNDLSESESEYIFVYKEEAFTSKICNSYVDFAVSYISSECSHEVICHEIKISEEDFNSKYGSNFYGTKNYYVVPQYMTEYVTRKIDNNALYNNIGLIEVGEKDGYIYLERKRWAKQFKPNEITYSLRDNLIDNGIYIGEGNIELKRNTFKFFNSCNVFENHQLIKNMIRVSNNK